MSETCTSQSLLSSDQIHQFQRDGVLVVNNVLDTNQIESALQGLSETLREHGVDMFHVRETGHNLTGLSSTNGSGGVLDVYYPSWKLDICTNEKLFYMTSQLWRSAYCHKGEALQDIPIDQRYKFHPYGAFDSHQGYCYLDRIGFRIPTQLAFEIGMDIITSSHTLAEEATLQESTSNSNPSVKPTIRTKHKVAIQRSLTPHLDCCPETFYSIETQTEGNNISKKHKWRPIQCFISLTDTLEPNQGGFEAVLGFHKEFYHWATQRSKSSSVKYHEHDPNCNDDDDKDSSSSTRFSNYIPAPCIGEYTHIRPKEDRDIFKRIQHIPNVQAGSAVFWDNRIPHANSYFHYGNSPRIVVYCPFLPNVQINQRYVQKQLQDYIHGRIPGSMDSYGDRWIHVKERAKARNKEKSEEDKQHGTLVNRDDEEEEATIKRVSRKDHDKDGDIIQSKNLLKESNFDQHTTVMEYNWTPLGRKLMGIEPW